MREDSCFLSAFAEIELDRFFGKVSLSMLPDGKDKSKRNSKENRIGELYSGRPTQDVKKNYELRTRP